MAAGASGSQTFAKKDGWRNRVKTADSTTPPWNSEFDVDAYPTHLEISIHIAWLLSRFATNWNRQVQRHVPNKSPSPFAITL